MTCCCCCCKICAAWRSDLRWDSQSWLETKVLGWESAPEPAADLGKHTWEITLNVQSRRPKKMLRNSDITIVIYHVQTTGPHFSSNSTQTKRKIVPWPEPRTVPHKLQDEQVMLDPPTAPPLYFPPGLPCPRGHRA